MLQFYNVVLFECFDLFTALEGTF